MRSLQPVAGRPILHSIEDVSPPTIVDGVVVALARHSVPVLCGQVGDRDTTRFTISVLLTRDKEAPHLLSPLRGEEAVFERITDRTLEVAQGRRPFVEGRHTAALRQTAGPDVELNTVEPI